MERTGIELAASLGDLLKFVDRGRVLGIECLNVYYYRVTSVTGMSGAYLSDIAVWLRDNVLIPVRAVQGASFNHEQIEAVNLSNPVDIATFVVSQTGTNGGDDSTTLPSYVVLNFKLNRTSGATRNGRKAISGLQEADVSGNAWVAGATKPNNIAAAMAMDVVLGIITVAEPVIVHRPIPIPAAGFVYSSIDTVTFRGLGSQNTRKPGSGN